MKKIIVSLGIALLLTNVLAQDRITGWEFATRSEVIAEHGMACTSQPLATDVALDVMKAGGTALDAAIAANAMLGLVEPTGCGLGGDCFALIYHADTAKVSAFDGSVPVFAPAPPMESFCSTIATRRPK